MLVRNSRNQLFVYKASREDLIHVYECRETMEALAAKLTASRISERDKKKLQQVIERKRILLFNSDSAINEGEVAERFTELCSTYHDIILESCQNPRLRLLINQIRELTTFYKHYKLRSGTRREIVYEEHKEICDAICNHDEERTETLMKKHLSTDLKHLLEQF